MKGKLKRLSALLLALMMCVSLMDFAVFAEGPEDNESPVAVENTPIDEADENEEYEPFVTIEVISNSQDDEDDEGRDDEHSGDDLQAEVHSVLSSVEQGVEKTHAPG